MSPTIWLVASGKMCILIINHLVLSHKHSCAFIYCYYNNLGLFYVHADQEEVCVPTATLQKVGCLSLYLFLLI